MHPDNIKAGEVTEIYNYICNKAKESGFLLKCDDTYQTQQIYIKDGGKPIGAVQYEGSNNFHKKLPNTISLRFNRHNLPESWKHFLEKKDFPNRKVLATVITHKFTENNKNNRDCIDNIFITLEKLGI